MDCSWMLCLMADLEQKNKNMIGLSRRIDGLRRKHEQHVAVWQCRHETIRMWLGMIG